ncbi:hypothetical protein BDM02DRAFT_3102628 [Thelephora ganbajun]|uniref:Uncharacterized protein n=1 Tax=Thelephora ganbajun TaxID=370292 RepID=A0ACB6Z5G0_THEGA|nr:hypothetical protein BDM02DRAFT_3102628 [Thelephora ganbajun]
METTLLGRGTTVIGGRRGPPPDPTQFGDTSGLREGNDLVAKIYWPEKTRTSEVDILRKAKEYGEKIDFIGNHIPEMVCHRDPKFLCSSTKTIRQFLGLPTDGSRCLRIIVFRRLRPIKELKEKEMLTAYLQCFFCHFCLWKKGIRHGDTNLGNLMWDDRRKVGVLNDFDLARLADQTGASGQDNTETLPFMALDLLSEEGLRGEIPRRYRHEAESFAWVLICLCLATVEGRDGKNCNMHPHPLLNWFGPWKTSRDAKIALQWREHDHPGILLVHPNAKTLARALHMFWLKRYNNQFPRQELGPGPRVGRLFGYETPNLPEAPPPYREPEDDTVFEDVLIVHELPLGSVPLKETEEELFKMLEKFQHIDWHA